MVGLAMVTVLVNLIQERIETLKDTASGNE